jgi:hypothetical protein
MAVQPPDPRQPERTLTWQNPELGRPLLLDEQRDDHDSRYLRTIARRAPGTTIEQAREEMARVAAELRTEYPEENGARQVLVPTLDEYLLSAARPTLWMLLFAGGAVLLIVCANVANLTLARGEERRGEFAVRAALGSGRGRLLRQVVVEAVVLACGGALVGTLGVYLGRDVLQAVQSRFFTGLVDVSLDIRVIAFTSAVAVGAGIVFGLPLARSASRPELRAALGEGGQRRAGRAQAATTRNLLIVGQVGITTTLLVVAALLSRSFNRLVNEPTGFEASGIVTFAVSPPSALYPLPTDVARYHREVR